jgi:hypothetical protein
MTAGQGFILSRSSSTERKQAHRQEMDAEFSGLECKAMHHTRLWWGDADS